MTTKAIERTDIEGITCPRTALQFARDLAAMATFAQAHAERTGHRAVHQGPEAPEIDWDTKRLAAPAVLSIDVAAAEVKAAQAAAETARVARAAVLAGEAAPR